MGNHRARPLCPGPRRPAPHSPDLEPGARDGREGCQVPRGEFNCTWCLIPSARSCTWVGLACVLGVLILILSTGMG